MRHGPFGERLAKLVPRLQLWLEGNASTETLRRGVGGLGGGGLGALDGLWRAHHALDDDALDDGLLLDLQSAVQTIFGRIGSGRKVYPATGKQKKTSTSQKRARDRHQKQEIPVYSPISTVICTSSVNNGKRQAD